MNSTPPFYCSKQARPIPIYGTVKPFKKLLAIETKHPMQERVLENNNFSNALNGYLAKLVQQFKNLKILLVKKNGRPKNQFKIFAYKFEGDIKETSFTLENSDQLLTLNLDNWFNSSSTFLAPKNTNRIFVCTNGKRDRCCAKFGLPLFKELSKQNNWDVWECSHIGGHRMAPTLITLPDMVFYGGINQLKMADFKTHLLENKIYLKGLRGRAHLTKMQQAAEYHLRHHLQLLNADLPITFSQYEEQLNDITTIKALVEQKQYKLKLKHVSSASKVYSSCDMQKLENISYYSLIDCQQIDL